MHNIAESGPFGGDTWKLAQAACRSQNDHVQTKTICTIRQSSPHACFNHIPLRRIDGYNVDIDRASFGHQVVEIETMSGKGATEIALASDGIAKLARSLLDQDEGSSTRSVKVEHTALVVFPFLSNRTVIFFHFLIPSFCFHTIFNRFVTISHPLFKP